MNTLSKGINVSHDYKPAPREVTTEELEHLPSPIHRAIAEDYIKKGYWKLTDSERP